MKIDVLKLKQLFETIYGSTNETYTWHQSERTVIWKYIYLRINVDHPEIKYNFSEP